MEAPERLVGARGDELVDRVLPAVRGHIAIRSGELVVMAREQGLVVPTGDVAARGAEWLALIEQLAGIFALDAANRPPELMPVLRDLKDIVEGSVSPASWWQRFAGGGQRTVSTDARQARVFGLLQALTDVMPAPPELARPLLGRLDGFLSVADSQALADLMDEIGRDTWILWGANGVGSTAWPGCYDVLAPASREAANRGLGLVYGAGY